MAQDAGPIPVTRSAVNDLPQVVRSSHDSQLSRASPHPNRVTEPQTTRRAPTASRKTALPGRNSAFSTPLGASPRRCFRQARPFPMRSASPRAMISSGSRFCMSRGSSTVATVTAR